MGLFGLSWGNIATGLASGVGFAVGGPIGAALVGGAASFATNMIDGQSLTHSLESAALTGAVGWIGGGLAGGALDGVTDAAENAVAGLGERFAGNATWAEAREFAMDDIGRTGWGSIAAGAGATAVNQGADKVYAGEVPAAKTTAITSIPTVNIGNGTDSNTITDASPYVTTASSGIPV
ncbi:hypothetical protein [Nocardia alni]|uniref:hypothetical protein n=1 Tax=Nocardia alni TaxID=2815723 RepID=UPI001C221867|nr:hypothetical protein [Nocardia alni]